MPLRLFALGPRSAACALVVIAGVAGGGAAANAPGNATATAAPLPVADSAHSSAEWLSRLPDGEEKRRFILDCTGCHLFDAQIARPGGRPRSESEWAAAVSRMLGFAGASTGFPVIASARDAQATAAWLTASLRDAPETRGEGKTASRSEVTEFPMPMPNDLPHDVQVDAEGKVVITGMFSHRMWVLDPSSGVMRDVAIPVDGANPRAVELAPNGDWWVVLGAPNKVARYSPALELWKTHDVGVYAHSVAVAPDGSAWFNGHFTKAPELLGRIDPASGEVRKVTLPPHPTLAAGPGGPIPYEVRAAPDGRVWMSELQGNRLVVHDPATGANDTFELPMPYGGPRRHDVAADGVVWVPAYAANTLLQLTPATRRWESHVLPVRDAVPYVARVHPRTGRVWVGTSAADAVLEFDPARRAWTTHALPSRGAMVRHLAFDPRSDDVWVAYGASPGIAARVARIRAATPAAR